MKTVTFSFKTTAERDRFMRSLNDSSKRTDLTSVEPITEALKTAKFDVQVKPEQDRICSLWVSGQKLAEGPFAEMQNKFQMECNSHSASVVLREFKSGSWADIMKRNIQPK